MKGSFLFYPVVVPILSVFLWFGMEQFKSSAWAMQGPAAKCQRALDCQTAKKVPFCHNTGSASNPLVFVCVSSSADPAHAGHHGDKIDSNLSCCEDTPNPKPEGGDLGKTGQPGGGHSGGLNWSTDNQKKWTTKYHDQMKGHNFYWGKNTWDAAIDMVLDGKYGEYKGDFAGRFYKNIGEMGVKYESDYPISIADGMTAMMATYQQIGWKKMDGAGLTKMAQEFYAAKTFVGNMNYDYVKESFAEIDKEAAIEFEINVKTISSGLWGNPNMYNNDNNPDVPLWVAVPAMISVAGDGAGVSGKTENQNTMERSKGDICAGNTTEQCNAKIKALKEAMGLPL